jgi:hypothetical protein
MTACFVKFAPTTCTVVAADPTAMVCGKTWLMFGVSVDCGIMPLPQPRLNKERETPTVATIVFSAFKKHSLKTITCCG